MKKKILVVEDDLDLHFMICKMIMNASYHVQSAYSGADAEKLLSQNEFSLVILDLMLPEVSGEELIQKIRQKSTVPILVTSAKADLADRVSVLESGADDYLVKPFEQAELLARVHSLLRRSQEFTPRVKQTTALNFAELTLVLERRECYLNEQKILLTSKEFDLLQLLLENPQTVFTKEQLYQRIWGQEYFIEDNGINVHISNLRKKLKQGSQLDYIETVWGIGFKLISLS